MKTPACLSSWEHMNCLYSVDGGIRQVRNDAQQFVKINGGRQSVIIPIDFCKSN
ncbi:hypothetical protein V6x_20230 [Gimesia chilikensis]|uniref:Uncharacterized protein n=1 Tax=Gimesia chilikensis TaxID=2605989 RepID=A0A517WAQ2_9PLAN|nr:hypothetical protein V6x_20230 [Gimesia chilikensis]